MYSANFQYKDEQTQCQGFLAFRDNKVKRRPAVMILPDWTGCHDWARELALHFADLGYVGFAVDVYGEGRFGQTTEEKAALMTPWTENRHALGRRLTAAFEALRSLPEVDPDNIAAVGFCFGGLCALDLARLNLGLAGVVSFHGLLNPIPGLALHKIASKILVLHGYDDPMVSPAQVDAFCQEMTKREADWQVHMFSNTKHAFANPNAKDPGLGTVYQPVSAERGFRLAQEFLQTIFR